jgi:hypothetical protein
LVGGRAAKRKTAQHKRTGIESDILLTLISFDSNEFDSIKLSERLSRDFQSNACVRSNS